MPETPGARRPGWLAELIAVVDQLCRETGSRSRATTAGKPVHTGSSSGDEPLRTVDARRVGRVTADQERGAGWFWLGLQGRRYDSDELDDAFLAPSDGAEQRKFQLIETVQEGNVLRIRAAEHAPHEDLHLWVAKGEPGLLQKSLRDGLSSISQFGLISRFAEGRADPLPAAVTGGVRGRTDDPSDRARIACSAPGVHLVWGPPGTGKTRVISFALSDLIGRGKSVLLVSGTNIAVDNALARAYSTLRTGPGTMIRVGKPELPDISGNAAVCLDTLIRDRQESLERERLAVQEQIRALEEGSVARELSAALDALRGFDADEFQAAGRRLDRAREIAARQDELDRLREQDAPLRAEADAGIAERDACKDAREAASAARRHIADAEQQQATVNTLESALRTAEAGVIDLERHRALLQTDPGAAGVTRRFGHGSAKSLLRSNQRELTGKIAYRDELRVRYQPLIASGKEVVSDHLRNARPYTRESLDQLDAALAAAQARAAEAAEAAREHARRTGELQDRITQETRQPQPTEADRRLVVNANARDLPSKLARLPGLQKQAEDNQRVIAKLEKDHERLLARMRREKSEVSRGIIREAKVVATTLARARMNREVWSRDYDFVIVDEVAAACPPEVVCASSRAKEGITLLGDFMQNSPILPDQFKRSRDPAVQQWYHQNCFALFGIHDARSAQANPGCITLTTQYRFGKVINDLANAIAYDDLLIVGPHAAADHEQDVVLIDVDGLGTELAGIRRNPGSTTGWWPIGALLAQALAEQRTEEFGQATGVTAGILTPFKPQQEIIQDFLTESGANPQIEVGTAHRFQGREFDTVVFDMVEDGKGWVAKGNLQGSSWAADGVRLFNVGITRARRRLYLIANGSAVRRAQAGPLLAVRKMLGSGDIRLISANTILGRPEPPADDPVADEVWHALRDHATLIDLYDDDRLPDALSSRIDQAKASIWLWSPWAARRSRQFLPQLRQAAERGVDVRPVIMPDSGVNTRTRPFHQAVAAELPQTIRMHDQHQKLIVIDRSLTFIGSMNVLSHVERGRLEVMALFRSGAFAQKILDHERADQLANPPTCPQCDAPVSLVRRLRDGQRGDYRLHWVCGNEHDGNRCDWKRPFPDQEGTRNQPRSRR